MSSTYIIGEIGQNHNGSVDLAKLICDLVARPIDEDLFNLKLDGMNAVKLTKRDLSQELSKSQMARLYDNENSFGKTYGEHRSYLELTDEQHFEVYQHAKKLGLDFVETLCAPGCTSLLKLFTPDYLKVASRDLTNIPLLEVLGETKIPIIISTGMAGKKELDDALLILSKHHEEISILHCVSEYPTRPQNANINTVKFLIDNYSKYTIGYSDHTIGISAPVAAVALGAKIIEKHITIDRRMKGTDQKGSLGPDGVNRMVRDIRLIEQSMGDEDIHISSSTGSAKEKLERSIASKVNIEKGTKISEEMLHMLSPGSGFKWSERSEVIGKVANQNIPEGEIIDSNYIK
ncbi:N-acetylneuraminate synthase family protein [Crocinitomicaceae bacterium]|nr:N-acetylneuraminate synthase family protein [Crocinitomicaceae bacterium]